MLRVIAPQMTWLRSVAWAAGTLFAASLLSGCSPSASDNGAPADSSRSTLATYRSTFKESPPPTAEQIANLAVAHNTLAFSLFQSKCAPTTISDNCLVATNAIARNLSMLAQGATGSASDKLRSALNLPIDAVAGAGSYALLDVTGESSVPTTISGNYAVSASFWGQYDAYFGIHFLDELTGRFLSELHGVDFLNSATQRSQEIASWQAAKTSNLLAGSAGTDNTTRLALTNTDYLSTAWPINTDVASERTGKFGQDMLATYSVLEGNFDVVQASDYMAFRLPLAANKELILVMPAAGVFSQVATGMSVSFVAELLASMTSQAVILYVPRFDITSTFDLGNYLINSGAGEVLSATGGNFIAISPEVGFYPNVLSHESRLTASAQGLLMGSVNYLSFMSPYPISYYDWFTNGSVAGYAFLMRADAGVSCSDWSLASNEFALNQPFLLVVRDGSSGTVLYAGQVGKVSSVACGRSLSWLSP